MSNVSWCGGPPGSQTKMTAGSFDVVFALASVGRKPPVNALVATATDPKRRN
jgi:hypothetical protein